MITMRNIWIMMLGICLFGCGAGKQPPSSQLSLTWKLEKDSVEARYWFFVKFGGNLFFISTVFFFLNPIKSCRYVCFLVTLKTPHH